jgi:hypothetical protein
MREVIVSVTFNRNVLLHAVVEHQKTSTHLYDWLGGQPEQVGQYRLVCLTTSSNAAWEVTHLLRAVGDGR